jgi:predicted TIM-barrel fold metal-dependent hydrolase
MNEFVLEAGAIPTLTWLDGTSEGEQAIEELFAVAIKSGAAAINIIPDRNYTAGVKDQKLKNLYEVVALAERHNFPVIVGTEMNAPGNKFVDDFQSAELKPLAPVFLTGAQIVHEHVQRGRQAGI